MDVGINLSPVNDYNREWVFCNVFAQSRSWRLIRNGQAQSPEVRVPVLENGYPDFSAIRESEGVQSLMLVDHDGHYPKGIYKAHWRGDVGRVVFKGREVIEVGRHRSGDGLWTAELDVKGDHGFALELYGASDITDIEVWMPTYEGKAFHPYFLASLYSFKYIRFLNWMNTNSVRQPHTWANRTTVNHVRQSYQPQGVALEAMLFLTNQTQTRPWFCMPHLADDDYIRRFAKMVKRMSRADKIYVEFSNETWNNMFPVHAWAKEQAEQQGIIWSHVVADAAKHMWDIWFEVFADSPERLVRVVGGHVVNKWVAAKVLERLNNQADMVAIATYLSVPKAQASTFTSATTAEEVLAVARSTQSVLTRGIVDHKTLGLPVGIYEGGQGIIGEEPWLRAAYAAQTLPGMYDATLENLRSAKTNGAECFGIFSYISKQESPHGSWGHLAFQEQVLSKQLKLEAPKAAAVRDFLK